MSFKLFNKKILYYGTGQAFNLLAPLIVAPYLIKTCDLEGFGKIGTAFAFSLFLILIVDYGFDMKGIKTVSELRNDQYLVQKKLVEALFTKAILFFVALAIGLLLIFTFFSDEKTLFLLTLMIVFAQVFNPTWFLLGIENFEASSMLNILSKSLYLLFIFIFVKTEANYIYVNFFLGLSAFFVNLLGLIYLFRRYHFKLFIPKMIDIHEILKQDFSLCLSQLFLSVKQISPIFIISFLFGYYITGQYKLIDQLISFFRSLTQVFLKFFYPKLCLEMIDNKKLALNFWTKYTFFLFSIVLLLLFLVLFFSKDVLLFFNVKTNNIYPLIYAFQASLLIPLLLVLVTALEQLMFIVQENRTYLKTIFYITFFNIFTILVFTQYWPLYGVIGAIILSEILFIIFYYYLAYKKVKNLIHV